MATAFCDVVAVPAPVVRHGQVLRFPLMRGIRLRRARAAMWRPNTLDRYLFAMAAKRLATIVAVVIAIMTLENAPRLAADLQHVDAPWVLLGRLSVYLIPEHLAVALPVGTLLAVALTVRGLSQRGEWQVLAASGVAPARVMVTPALLGLLVALALLANGLWARPAGERRLDALYAEIVAGTHGLPVPIGETVTLGVDTTFLADAIRPGAPGAPARLSGILVHRGPAVIGAREAMVASDGHGGVQVRLVDGTSTEFRADGASRRIAFAAMTLHGSLPGIGLVPGNLRHQLDRSGGLGLWRLATAGDTAAARHAAAAALLGRIDAGLFCLLLPLLGLVVGTPPRRKPGGPALLLGIVLVVLHLQSAAWVEDSVAAHALPATIAHLAAWTAITAGLLRYAGRREEGALDLLMGRAGATLKALVRRNDTAHMA